VGDGPFSTDRWLRLSPEELAAPSEELNGVPARWADREVPDDGRRGEPDLRVMTVFGAASNLGLTGYQAILVVFLVREVGASPGMVGGLVAAMSLGGVLGAALATPPPGGCGG
jgi:hypothetical protein